MPDTTLIPITQVAREVARITSDGSTVGYTRLYKAALDNRIAATQGNNGRWHVEKSKIAEIARIMGLPLAADRVAA